MKLASKAFDVSHYQKPASVDYRAAKADGYGLVVINFTDGTKPDPVAREHYNRAKDAGLLVGAYHYVWSDPTPDQQIDAFRKAIEGLTFDVEPWLDIEAPDVFTRAGRAHRMAIALGSPFANATIYINPNDDVACGHPSWMRHHTLSQARYRAAGTAPPLPGAGILPSWQHCYHQWTGNGRVSWYSGAIDLIVYDPDRIPMIGAPPVSDTEPAPPRVGVGTRLSDLGCKVEQAQKLLADVAASIEELEDEL